MRKSGRHPSHRVREPVQVYLDRPDRDLLEQLVEVTGLSRAELMRRGLRVLAADKLVTRPPGWSMENLIGAFGDAPSIPRDLSQRHDEYLARVLEDEQNLG